ncbi:response regulator transcription factor [Lysinibacillus sp. FSL M8-0216]|uniref:Heme response regulator HssR n=1 Tax=Lysinibacillus fusiformis TaxID=28031 RepID=A0A1H9K6A5_9BACI|nr:MULTISPECIES: response regulator transcription factor [Lysinibacillus]MCG7436407.1 response regulator transcription factor [Lysinibacillus fusiformis]MED4669933.1 response regulator transcription factor [Lysinibacillus fusiformis]QAS56372.1 DNA-binding response regulator [Lysinibacillus sphaericus]RDV31355.1 DNA-binding response regulator [Lysinibacillus fusiformis]SCX58874.1 DNA-binding response regulator, OmpR family, contains REC and winged-helix (wHTH) domain [Lysinibacillus fusiformis]
MTTILVADDDANIRELVCLFLRKEGFATVEAEDGKAALSIYHSTPVDLVVLDIMMPTMDGWTLCKELRRANAEIPLLMLTARGETWEKVKGFELGTDDYLTKPFDPLELTVRVKALLKRYRIGYSQTIKLGAITLDRQTYKVMTRTDSITLPLKEFELLYKLAETPGQVYTREQLIDQIWGIDYAGDNRTIDVHIKRLRERFAMIADFHIETIRGLGYRLEVDE